MQDNIDEVLIGRIEKQIDANMEQLVDETARHLGMKRHLIARSLFSLWKEGKIRIEDPTPAKSLTRYVLSSNSLRFWSVVSMILITLFAVYLLPRNHPYLYIRYLTGTLLVLYFPGSSLVECLFPRREDLASLERLALSIGLSLALTPIVGLLLNYTPWGIRLDPIFTSLVFLTLGFSFIALVRRFTYFRLAQITKGE